jgi:hypothetical protein
MRPASDAPVSVLDDDHAAFMQSGLSIVVASRNADNVPSVARAFACRVAADRRSVTLLLWAPQAGTLLADLRATRAIAAVFSRPSTHRTIQVKGRDAAQAPVADDDRALVAHHTDLLVAGLDPLGFAPRLIRTYFHCEPDELVAIAFTPSAAFDQTPGPRAGRPLAR